MKRFIRYLYEYEQGKRIRNVGFAKVEAGDEKTIVNVQAKGFHNGNERELVLYLFYEENSKIVGIRLAEMTLETQVLSRHLAYTVDDVGKADNYSRISGILIKTANGRMIAATWDDRCVDVGKMEEFEENNLQSKRLSGPEEEESGAEAREIDKLGPQGKRFMKIQRKDISKLPRCEWQLANNQFLIYGYNNYHHLVLIEEGNILKIGVPGIYHIKEAKAADTFGFGEFLSVEEINISLNEDERHQNEPFGYWCRPVRKHRNILN